MSKSPAPRLSLAEAEAFILLHALGDTPARPVELAARLGLDPGLCGAVAEALRSLCLQGLAMVDEDGRVAPSATGGWQLSAALEGLGLA